MQNKTIQEHWTDAKEYFRKRAERGCIEYPTGLRTIDFSTDGLRKGEIWIIAGRAGSGKTSLALQMANSMAKNPEHSILFLSLEMNGWELVTRMFCEMNQEFYTDLVKGYKSDQFYEKDKKFTEHLESIDFEIFEHGYSFAEIEKILSGSYSKKKPDVIFIDFVQLVEWKQFKDERIAIMEYVRKLKELAKFHDVGIVLCSQLRRYAPGTTDRPPDMSDLMGSGSLEQTADKVILLYKKVEKGTMTYMLKLAKNRQGETFEKEILFQGFYYKFIDKKDDA